MNILLGYVLTYGYIFVILLISNLLKKKPLLSRKFVHIMVTFSWLIMMYFFKYSINIIILPLTMVLVNVLSYKFNLFKGMESEKSLGTIYYAISWSIMAIITYFFHDFKTCYYLGAFIMGIGDGFAPLVGKFDKTKKLINDKTTLGSLTVFVVTLILMLTALPHAHYFYIFLTSVFCTFIELYSRKGMDNIYLPLGSSFLIYVLFF